MPDPAARETQITDALRATAEIRAQGWGKATVEVTRGGTVRVVVETGDGDKIARPQFGSGRVK